MASKLQQILFDYLEILFLNIGDKLNILIVFIEILTFHSDACPFGAITSALPNRPKFSCLKSVIWSCSTAIKNVCLFSQFHANTHKKKLYVFLIARCRSFSLLWPLIFIRPSSGLPPSALKPLHLVVHQRWRQPRCGPLLSVCPISSYLVSSRI